MSQEEKVSEELQEKQRKRSKRHRINRNHISDKDRVQSVKEFGIYARQVEKDYQSRYPEKNKFNF